MVLVQEEDWKIARRRKGKISYNNDIRKKKKKEDVMRNARNNGG